MCHIYTHTHTHTHRHTHTMEYYSAIKRMSICNSMYRAREYNAKQDKSVRERQTPCGLTHMWNLRNKAEKQRKMREREREREREKPRKRP